jgi:DNA-binding HxlR family transcriptional regulator
LTDRGTLLHSPREEIDDALNSTSKFKILIALGNHADSPLSLYALRKETGLSKRLLEERLTTLISCDWIQAKGGDVGTKRYMLNLANPRTSLFLEFLHKAEYYSEA